VEIKFPRFFLTRETAMKKTNMTLLINFSNPCAFVRNIFPKRSFVKLFTLSASIGKLIMSTKIEKLLDILKLSLSHHVLI